MKSDDNDFGAAVETNGEETGAKAFGDYHCFIVFGDKSIIIALPVSGVYNRCADKRKADLPTVGMSCKGKRGFGTFGESIRRVCY